LQKNGGNNPRGGERNASRREQSRGTDNSGTLVPRGQQTVPQTPVKVEGMGKIEKGFITTSGGENAAGNITVVLDGQAKLGSPIGINLGTALISMKDNFDMSTIKGDGINTENNTVEVTVSMWDKTNSQSVVHTNFQGIIEGKDQITPESIESITVTGVTFQNVETGELQEFKMKITPQVEAGKDKVEQGNVQLAESPVADVVLPLVASSGIMGKVVVGAIKVSQALNSNSPQEGARVARAEDGIGPLSTAIEKQAPGIPTGGPAGNEATIDAPVLTIRTSPMQRAESLNSQPTLQTQDTKPLSKTPPRAPPRLIPTS